MEKEEEIGEERKRDIRKEEEERRKQDAERLTDRIRD
jgi:hypothetical protein